MRKTWETINEVTRRKSDKPAINELELNGMSITTPPKSQRVLTNFSQKSVPNCPGTLEKLAPPSMNLLFKQAVALVSSE